MYFIWIDILTFSFLRAFLVYVPSFYAIVNKTTLKGRYVMKLNENHHQLKYNLLKLLTEMEGLDGS